MNADLKDLKVYFYDQRDKRFIRAVENVGFEVKEGSVLGIVGESGCGKTVTALSMMGLTDSEPGIIGGEFFFKPAEADFPVIERAVLRGMKNTADYRRGDLLNLFYGLENFVSFDKNPLTIIKDTEKWLRRNDRIMEHVRGKNISMVFQSPGQSLNPFTTVGVQLKSTIRRFNRGKDRVEINEMAGELLRSVRLMRPDVVMNMHSSSLSVGIAQRVVIAIALSSNPRLLIADEPTTGLDTTNVHKIIELLEILMSEMNLTLIFISHNIHLVSTIASDIAVMYAGIIVEHGMRKDVIKTRRGPKHPYTEALVSSVPTDSDIKRGKKLRIIQGSVPNNKVAITGCPFLTR
ncbi:MAG: ABC transporter ATP-binding protein, partial [Spirochaetes bacterium]|nr:ABC transporter ATP-binding protein [Spirochaetota bacterium]